MPKQDEKKVYRNSECSKCGTCEEQLKYKEGFGIVCRECFREMYKKEKRMIDERYTKR
jgi:ribosomal protein S14